MQVVSHLFVYGTLMAGECNADRIPDGLVLRRRTARVRGVLVDLGRYPALRLDGSGGDVIGEPLQFSPAPAPALLAELDAFEGPGYARHTLTVLVDGEFAPVVAWGFVQISRGADGPTIPDGDWRAWRRRRDRDQTV